MKYYFYIDQNPSSPTYEKPRSVIRVNLSPGNHASERYDFKQKKWVDDPDVMRSLSGIGGDGNQFQKTTEAGAQEFIHKKETTLTR